MSYFGPYLDPDIPLTEPETYCVLFGIPLGMPPEHAREMKEQKLKELYVKALAGLELRRPYAITIDFAPVPGHVSDDERRLCDTWWKWTLRLDSVRTQIVEVPRIEETHYNLPATDSLKERVAAAWNYIRGKGELSV